MLPLRIFRSFHAKYYQDDILSGPAAYPEEYFARLIENGFNAVWLRGILRDLAPTSIFPELGQEVARHQDALGTVVERAARFGAQALLYLNEPLCLPRDHPFWQAHPQMRGCPGDSDMDEWPETYAFCTSTPEAQAWLREVTANLFRDVPGLGGWFLITASEHHTHCYSHAWPLGSDPGCPRCAGRPAHEVVAEVITALREGTRASSDSARCIAWNWSWGDVIEADPQPELLGRLPKDVAILLDWERGSHRIMPNGKVNWVDEYSLMFLGPSERFLGACREAQRRGLPVMAKLQVGTTHELATVPNLPLADHLYEKLSRCEQLGLAGVLATWNFGNDFSLNTAAVGRFVKDPARPSPHEFVRRLAEAYFPGADAEKVALAIERFSAAMEHFPYDRPILYHGPQNYALTYPLTLAPLGGKSVGRTWVMDERGDDFSPTEGQFTIQEIIALLSALVAEWEVGLALYREALAGCAHPHAAIELGVATVIGLAYRSAINVYRVYLLRRERPGDAEERFRAVIADEIANLEAALPYLEADPRLGFHAECQAYQFTPEGVRAKLAQLRAMDSG